MSDISGPFSIYIEDWSSATMTDVIPAGQKRWYDGVTGYNTSEIIELVGDGSTQVQNLAKRQPSTDGAQTLYGVKTFDDIPVLPATAPTSSNQAASKSYVDGIAGQTFNVIDTDSGDVAATTPSSPVNGEGWVVVNSGSSGNHVTGLPGSISLGDGKTISFKYDSTNATWRYEDVIIDEYQGAASGTNITSGTHYVFKWSGGKMVITMHLISSSTGTRDPDLPEPFNTHEITLFEAIPGGTDGRFTSNIAGTSDTAYRTYSGATSNVQGNVYARFEGRWKA